MFPGSSHLPSPKATERRATKSLRILVVDDEATAREIISVYLKKAGHEVHVAETGTAGLAEAEQKKWDLVLTDGKLGDMTGRELALAIKGINPHLPVILVTGSQAPPQQGTVPGSPFDAILEKPFRREALHSVIATVCG